MDLLKDFLVAVGGGVTALIALLTIFKSMFMKFFEKGIDTAFDKKLEKYRNRLTRATTAYDLLLEKEMGYYTKIDVLFAELIVLVQDLVYESTKKDEGKSDDQRTRYKEHILRFLEMIIEIKNLDLVHQAYIPSDIFSAGTSVIMSMQDNVEHWQQVGLILFEQADGKIDIEKSEKIKDEILMNIACVETLIKKRLKELSEIE